jgi:hypothetical protein
VSVLLDLGAIFLLLLVFLSNHFSSVFSTAFIYDILLILFAQLSSKAKLQSDLLSVLLLNPVIVLHFFKQLGHIGLKATKAGLLLRFVNLADEVIDHHHDKVIVVTTLPVLENDATVGEVVVGQRLDVVHFPHRLFHLLVDKGRISQRVLC